MELEPQEYIYNYERLRKPNRYSYAFLYDFHEEEALALQLIEDAIIENNMDWMETEWAEQLCLHCGFNRDKLVGMIPYYRERR